MQKRGKCSQQTKIRDSVFEHNRISITSQSSIVKFKNLSVSHVADYSYGGAIHVSMKGNNSQNSKLTVHFITILLSLEGLLALYFEITHVETMSLASFPATWPWSKVVEQ